MQEKCMLKISDCDKCKLDFSKLNKEGDEEDVRQE